MDKVKFPIQYAPLFDTNIREIVEPSGRVSAKTTSNCITAIKTMLENKRNNVWFCRAEKVDIRSTVFSAMVGEIQRNGLEHLFSWKTSPFEICCTRTGAMCYFSGINGKTDDDISATKGFVPQYNTLSLCILDEADEVKHQNHITAWESTAVRFLLPHGKMVFAFNPPMNKSHWAVKFFGDKIRNGATEIKCTWQDIYELLPQRTIEQILKFKEDEPDYYRYWYLGEYVSFKGMVYPQLDRRRHCIDIWSYMAQSNDRPSELIVGIDEGTANDSTCATPLLVMKSGKAIVLDCFENDPLIAGQQAPTQQSTALYKWLQNLLGLFPFLMTIPRTWIFECAEGGQMLKLQFEMDHGETCLLVEKKSIIGDILRVRSMLAEGILLFHVQNNVNTRQLLDDMENYQFDERTNTIKADQRDDTIDSLEYATKLYYNLPMRG